VTGRAFSRAVTILAVGFLSLDAALLAMIERYVWAAVCGVAAILVVLAWRRYARVMAELIDARREMKREVESLRALLHTQQRK
jgi:hypothetical protein